MSRHSYSLMNTRGKEGYTWSSEGWLLPERGGVRRWGWLGREQHPSEGTRGRAQPWGQPRLLGTGGWINRAQDEAGAGLYHSRRCSSGRGLMAEAQLKSSSQGKGLWPRAERGPVWRGCSRTPCLGPQPRQASRTDPPRALTCALHSLNL